MGFWKELVVELRSVQGGRKHNHRKGHSGEKIRSKIGTRGGKPVDPLYNHSVEHILDA